jgi:uncharacterized membrane protein required for colicin V production
VTVQFDTRNRFNKDLIPPVLILALGTLGVVALLWLTPGFQVLDLLLLLVVVGFAAVGYTQGIIRGIMTAVIIYIATGIAATFYTLPAPYVGTLGQLFRLIFAGQVVEGELGASYGENVTRDSLAVSFFLLTIVIWIILGAASRSAFRDTSLPGLGVLDKLGGALVYFFVGLLVASLAFNTLGYGRFRQVHNESLLRYRFNQVLSLHCNAQAFWFPPGKLPPIYAYDLDLAREP